MTAEERERRIGMNEAIFRDVNERLEEVISQFGSAQHELDLVCECGDAECVARITVPASEYQAVRADPVLFLVAPGHEEGADVESVVERRKRYEVVAKEGVASRIAERTDPRP